MSKKKKHAITIRSSAAEYLTFLTASREGGVEAIYADEDVWLSQKMMGVLYDVNVRTVNEHLKNIFADSELEEISVVRKFRITATDGKTYETQHYNLSAIIAVGYKVNSERAVQFRKWATGIIKEYTVKGFAMDDERLNRFIAATDREILQDAGKVTAEIAKAHAESEFEKYRIVQDRLYVSDFDKQIQALETPGDHTLQLGDQATDNQGGEA
jgi:hypothetical protein